METSPRNPHIGCPLDRGNIPPAVGFAAVAAGNERAMCIAGFAFLALADYVVRLRFAT
jgi:hypothetical protein